MSACLSGFRISYSSVCVRADLLVAASASGGVPVKVPIEPAKKVLVKVPINDAQ